ncbi:MAG: InlB B-repeat-containing protein [Salinivirgaceae bacterium]|nr:InlB B-repeat-containing protein [Salinivirgaceae bacterium]
MRRHLLLTLALVLGSLTGAWAAIEKYAYPLTNGEEGQGTVYYEMNTETKEATVVAGTWQYTKTIVIPDEVEYKGEQYKVTTIGYRAFKWCYDLEMVVFGANVSKIVSGAFYMCGTDACPLVLNLESDGLEIIEANAIQQCVLGANVAATKTILLGKNIRQLGPASETDKSNWFTWGNRYDVQKFAVAEGNTKFCTDEKGVLYDIDKKVLIAVPTYFQEDTYTIPASVLTIRSYALYRMSKLRTVKGGDNVVRIGDVISYISSLHIGSNVTDINNTAFMYCSDNFIPDIAAGNTKFLLKDNVLFKCATPDTILMWYLKANTTANYVMPSFVTEIGNYAFYPNQYIKTIDFINNTKITPAKIGSEAFLSTKYSVEFLNAANIYTYVDGVCYTKDLTKMVVYGSDVETENYVMPEPTTTVPRAAIKSNSHVKTFAINKKLKTTDTENYYLMSSLERYSVDSQNDYFSSDTAGVLYNKGKTKLLSYPRANTRSYYKVADGTTTIATHAFYNNKYLKVLDLGSSITTVVDGNNYTLAGMVGLEAIKVSTMVPPYVTTSSFTTTQLTSGKIKLYVPIDTTGGKESAADIYANASIWNKFYIIRDTSRFESDLREIDVDYAINHYLQNVDNDEYTKAETNNTKGKLLSTTAVSPKTTGDYAGFEPQQFNQITLNNSNMSVDIYYHRRYFSVTWMNGDSQISTKSYRFGAPFLDDKPANPTPAAGKHFLGWNTDANAAVALTFNGSERVLANTTYYAIFADNASKKYHVEHYQENANDNGYTKVDTDEDSKPFGLKTTAAAKIYEGFTAQPFSQQTIAEDESTVVRIDYKRDSSTVTWKNGANTVLTGKYKYGSTLVVPNEPAAPEATQHFVGWNTNASASTAMPVATQTVPLNETTYYAIFADNESKTYTVEHYQQNLDGKTYTRVDGDTESGSGLVGGPTQATANTYAGFTVQPFNQETIAESGTVVKIYYNRNKYDVVWKKGTVELSRNTNVMFGEAITKPDDPQAEAGYHFAGWNSDSQATSAMNLSGATVPVGGITYYAVFAINATVHYTVKHYQESLNGGYPNAPENVDEGTGVFGLKTTAAARTYEGFTAQPFNQETIKEDESTVVRIEYKRKTHSLTWIGNGGSLSGGTSGNAIKYGASITAPTATQTGYTFRGWGTSANADITITPAATMPDEDLTYYAIWNINQYHAAFYLNNGTDEEFTGNDFDYGAKITPPGGHPNTSDYEYHDWLGWSDAPAGSIITNDDYGYMGIGGVSFYAIWKIHSNQLSWNANGGDVLTGNYTSGMVDYGTTIKKPNTPTRIGYTFKGWATTADGTPTEVLTKMPDNAVSYYAIWQINQHTLTWNANGGVLATDGTNGTVNYNTEITPATTADREGYTFKGWNTSANATTTIEPAVTMPDADLTYYAVWQVHQHNIKWYPNGGSFTNSDPSGLVNYGDTIKMPLVNRTDWKMSGWGLTQDATPDDVITPKETMPDHDLTYYAIWILKTNYVTWKLNYNAEDDKNHTSTSVDVGNQIVAPANAPTREHYQFRGWSETRDGEPVTNFGIMDESKKTFYAIWQINSNTLAWDANGGTILSNGTNGNVEFGAPLTPATTERTGYEFKGWATSATATENELVEITSMPDAPTTYYAVWAPKTYQVEWKYNNGTNDNFTVTDAIFDADIDAPNSNPTRDYNNFVGWAATPEGEVLSDYGKLTTEGATFYAKWQLKKFNLAWDANGGELSGEYTQGEVEYGTPIVTPTATLTNYIFAGWGTSTNPNSIVNVTSMPDSSMTLVANWLANTYVVEWRMNDGTDDNYTATNVDYGNAIIAPADDPERPNYQFLGWTDENGELVDDFGTMQTDHIIFYAQWQKNSHELTWNANGGQLSGDYTSGNVEVGTEIIRPVAERKGYTFNGWNTYAEAVDSISISTMPDNSVEYFAIWNVNNYVATWYFDADSVFANINLNYADTIKAPSVNLDNNGYAFLGWSATEAGSVIDSFGLMPAADTAFYAVWQKIAEDKKFAILWYRNDGTSDVFVTDSLTQGENIVAPTVNPDRADYKFVGWSVTTDGETIAEFGKIVSDTAFYAVWQIQDTTTPITSTFVATWYMNNGTDSVFTASIFAQGDSIVAPSVNPNRAGYTFLGWSTETAGTFVAEFGVITSDTAFYAVWLKDNCLIQWMFEQDSVFKTDTLFYGDAIIAPAVNPVREQYAFKGWAMSGDSALVDFGSANSSESLFYAVWEEIVVPQYRAVWYFNDGTNSAFTTTMVTEGAAITAPASNPKRDDYLFKGWAASADGAVTTNFGTMSANGAAFYAVWEALVSFTAPAIYNTCESGVDHIELTDINNSQITFEWNINGDIDSTQTDGYLEFTDDMALSGTIEVTGILGDTRVTKTISYQRNKEILRTMWDDVITVVNGKGYFKSYRWYQNGVLVDTTDMHYEKGGLTGTYYLVATTVDSVEITSCEMSFGEPQPTAITVYPNPVVNSIVVEGDNVKAGNTITIIDNDGKVRIAKEISGEGSEEVNVSALQQGIYVVKVGEETISIIKF